MDHAHRFQGMAMLITALPFALSVASLLAAGKPDTVFIYAGDRSRGSFPAMAIPS